MVTEKMTFARKVVDAGERSFVTSALRKAKDVVAIHCWTEVKGKPTECVD